ncbi:RraA family protein [Microbacterium sp.]|uniref:RraA family protein n=1 Tax=Microbacterium sp. TaxID=51671 RepID=UPI000B02BEAA|nr:RraA family protein [Microbacterium sp.]MBN9185799.1 RraA family protein [Microbacterium sp.]MBN9187996.1 RraA family protein [Microbacterium sp.]MBN9194250.1 RraA family protein [Microbacterium sp.]
MKVTNIEGDERFDVMRSELYTPVVGDILDALGYRRQFLPPGIRAIREGMRVVGRAMTVLLTDVTGPQPRPFGRLTEALDQLEAGEVYLAQNATMPSAAWGEILTATARQRGAVGAVVDGYHRDTPKVLEQDFPVFSLGAYAQDSAVRSSVVDFRCRIRIGDVEIESGDIVFGDVDGVLIIPSAVEDEVIERALTKARTENVVRDAIERGMSSTEAFRVYGVL